MVQEKAGLSFPVCGQTICRNQSREGFYVIRELAVKGAIPPVPQRHARQLEAMGRDHVHFEQNQIAAHFVTLACGVSFPFSA